MRRDDWVAAESGGLLDRLFGGRIAPLVACFGSQRKLSPKDIQELRKLIDEFDDGE
jgi:predicted transcriptional regulator